MRRKENSKIKSITNIKQNVKGITLIALVVTIIILLILATVTINLAVGQNGLFGRAKNAVNAYKIAEANESQGLSELIDAMDGIETMQLSDAQNRNPATSNTIAKVPDALGNTIYVPVGFCIVKDSTTTSNKAPTKVSEGIVISDKKDDDIDNNKGGNQFVWIPVGTISTTATGSNDKTITLGRYSFDTNGVASPWTDTSSYVEETSAEHTASGLGNAIAKDIEAFKTSATSKGGYYLARYEAGVGTNTTLDTSSWSSGTAPNANWTGYTNGTLVSQAGKQVWNYVTQKKASELAKGMYSTVNSDLINSYAWETAIVFIEQCGTESNHSNYANQIGISEDDTLGTTGSKKLKTPNAIDEQCNIYDMAGNVSEWTTESYSYIYGPCVIRGGSYHGSDIYTARRGVNDTTGASDGVGFRPLLYL